MRKEPEYTEKGITVSLIEALYCLINEIVNVYGKLSEDELWTEIYKDDIDEEGDGIFYLLMDIEKFEIDGYKMNKYELEDIFKSKDFDEFKAKYE